MKLQPAVKKETFRIAMGTFACTIVMLIVYAVLGRLNVSVILSGVIGGFIAALNFLFLGITVQKVSLAEDENIGKKMMHFSYSIRMLLMLVWVLIAMAVPGLNWVAAGVPLLFPRITIAAMQMTGYYKKEETAK